MAQPFTKVLIVGSGSWGTALANVFADSGQDTAIWGRDPEVLRTIEEKKTNPKYLKGLPLSSKLNVEFDLSKAINEASLIVSAIPTQQIRAVFGSLKREL